MAHQCRRKKYDGVICGHIHHAEIRTIEDVLYMNCGDWVESCTALVEDSNGNFKIIDWLHEPTVNTENVFELPLEGERLSA